MYGRLIEARGTGTGTRTCAVRKIENCHDSEKHMPSNKMMNFVLNMLTILMERFVSKRTVLQRNLVTSVPSNSSGNSSSDGDLGTSAKTGAKTGSKRRK